MIKRFVLALFVAISFAGISQPVFADNTEDSEGIGDGGMPEEGVSTGMPEEGVSTGMPEEGVSTGMPEEGVVGGESESSE